MSEAYSKDPEKFRKRTRDWRQNHLHEIRSQDKNRRLLKRYGLTIEERDQMIEDQGGKCALCKRDFHDKNKPNVDHDHETGRVRGILCFSCNQALGKLGDTYAKMLSVLEYLKDKE